VIRAPGKLVLAGEYAVLDGAPALVLAVDRGVECHVEPASDLEIQVPGGDDRFVRAALLAVHAPPARYVFRDWNPVDLPEKPGFGGSAAATVAAVLAGGGRGEVAFEVHRRVQGGGSGIDVAASLRGGWVRFERGVATSAPAGTVPVVVFSGRGAATMDRVHRYLAWSPREAFVEGVTAAVDAFSDDPVGITRHLRRVYVEMAQKAGFLYETPGLADIAGLAEARGGAARPSGAGGGDCTIAFFPDEGARIAFAHDVWSAGYVVIPVQPALAAGPVEAP